jgi:hypothetical protein
MTPILAISGHITWGEVLVGGGTFALACVTVWLGFETRASAKAAREAVEASEEPYVIPAVTPPDIALEMGHVEEQDPFGLPTALYAIHRAMMGGSRIDHLWLRLWNIGDGPAIVTGVGLQWTETDLLGPLDALYSVPAGGVADIRVPCPKWPSVFDQPGALTIDYVRASGTHYQTTSEVRFNDPTLRCVTYARTRLE